MSKNKNIIIWNGSVFSPPTIANGQLALNICLYLKGVLGENKKYNYYFVPTNKYYNKPWVRCVSEEDRVYMLNKLIENMEKTYTIPKNVSFHVSEYEIEKGKKLKNPLTTIESIEQFKQKHDIYIVSAMDHLVQRVKGYWSNSLELFFMCNIIVFDDFSGQIIDSDQSEKYIYNSINMKSLLKQKRPKELLDFMKKNNITERMIVEYIEKGSHSEKIELIKKLILSKFVFLPKKMVPVNYKSAIGPRIRQELKIYYSTADNIEALTNPETLKYIKDNQLYKECGDKYIGKLVSSKKTRRKKLKSKYSKRRK